MSKYCPNKNTEDFKKMSSVLGDEVATSVWYSNQGQPVWNTKEGIPSKLYIDLQSLPGVSNDEDTVMAMKSRMYTKSYKAHQANKGISIEQEPTVEEFVRTLDEIDAKKATIERYKKFNLLDKTDPTKPIKWAKTDANYKKVLKIAQNINAGTTTSARIIDVPANGKTYLTILLTPKTAFTTEDGQQVAHFDAETGTITFTDKGLTAETVVHEFAHPFVDALAKNNPELFKNLLNDIKKDAKVPQIKKIIDHVNAHYSEAGNEILDKELLAYTISEYGKGNIDPATGKNTKSAIKRFYKWLTTLAKDLMDQMRQKKTLFVDQIHPQTKYNEIADLFTVYSELGDINLGTSATLSKKIAPETITGVTKTTAPKETALQKKMRERREAKEKGGTPPAHKMVNTKAVEFVDIKDEAKHMSSLLPKEIATELTPGYIKVLEGGNAVVGMFKNSMITLSEKGPRGTAYHEGFHAVFRTLLDGTEQRAIIAEARKLYVEPTAKDIFDLTLRHDISEADAETLYYEEILADEFAEFMHAPTRRSFPEKVRNFFRQLGEWISRIFNNPTKVDKLFNGIKKGKYTKRTPNIQRGVAYKVHPNFSIQEVNKITRELTSVAFENISTIDDLKSNGATMERIADRIADVAIEAEDTGNIEVIEQLELLFDQESGEIDNFWLREIDSYMRNSLGLKSVRSKKSPTDKVTEEDQDEQNQEDLERQNFLKSSYEVSGKVNATAAVKFMVAMTPQMQLIDPSKQPTVDNMTQILSPLTGLPVLVDFGMTYNDLENILSDTVSARDASGELQDGLELMLDIMKTHAKYKPELLLLADKLDNASEEIRTQFFNAFSRQKGSFVHHQITGKAENKNIKSQFTASNFSTKSTVIRDNWTQAFAKEFGMVKDKELVYNPTKIERFLAAREKLIEMAGEQERLIEEGEAKINGSVLQNFKSLLNFMGVTVNPNTLNYIVESRMDLDSGFEYDVEYIQQANNLIYEFTLATNDLAKREGSIHGENNHITDNTTFFKNILAEAEAYFKKIPGENSFVGPDGNNIYSYQDNDLTSKAVNQIKQGDLTHLKMVKNSAYGKHSIWAHELMHPVNGPSNREDFQLHMYGNLKSEQTAGDKGAKASELKPIDAYMDNVNKHLAGYYVGLAEADKSRQTYFKGPKFRRSEFTINADGEYMMNKKGEGAKILKGYLADELSRMSIAHDVVFGTESADPAPEKDLVLYYHYYPVAPGTGEFGEKKDKIRGNAFYSFLFPGEDFKALGLQSPDGKPLRRNDNNFWNNDAVNSMVTNAFAKLVDSELKYASAIGLIEESTGGSYTNKLISKGIVEDPKRNYMQGGAIDVTRMMADYVLNSLIGNIEQTKLFNGDPAIYKVKGVGKKPWAQLDHFGDLKKRIPAIFAAGKDFRIFNKKDGTPVVRPHYTSATIANIEVPSAFFGDKNEDGEVIFNKENMEEVQKATGLSMEKLESLFSPYLEINQTDAQAWITLDAYKERMQGLGKWTDKHETAYEQSRAGANMSAEDVKMLAQPLKTVHAELVPTKNGELIMQYNKQSEAVLLPFMKDMEIGQLMKAMESATNPIDHVIVLDGKKAGASGIVDITDSNGKIMEAKDIKMNAVTLSYNNLFLQQDLPSKGIKDTLVGSQGTKNVLSVVALDGDYANDMNGREVVQKFHATIGKLSDQGLVSLDKSVGYDKGKNEFEMDSNGRSKVHKIVQREFEGEISENHQQALEENIAFDALPIKNKIMNKLMALVTKKTVKLKQTGGALIQLSDLGFIGSEQKLSDKVKNGIIWFKDPKKRLEPMSVKGGEVKAAQILIPHGQLIKMLATDPDVLARMEEKFGTKDFKDLSHSELKSMLSPAMLEGMSYRIPNQGPSSNDAFEIVGVLPAEMGDTMVAFSDITTKTGSDFDIDKAFVILPNFYYNKETKKIQKTGYDIANLDKNSKSSLENLRLDLMREMLMHPSAYASVMAPLDDDTLEKFIKELFPAETTSNAMEFFTGRYQLGTKTTFDGAKALVGVIANHMTNHSLALSEDLRFFEYYLGKGIAENGQSIISNKKDVEGNEVAGTLGAYMNAIVDAAKDPFIVRANLNHYTAGTAFMMARTGVEPEWIAAFIGQPILRDVILAQDAAEGRFGKPVFSASQGKYLSPVETVLENYGLQDVTEAEFRARAAYPTMRKDLESEIDTTVEQLVGTIKNVNMDSAGYKKSQLKVLKQFLEWQTKASQLNDVIKISKADVEGATKTLMTAQLAKNLFEKTMRDGHITNLSSYFGVSFNETSGEFEFATGNEGKMIGRYFENSVLGALKRFSKFFIAGSKASEHTVKTVAQWAGYTELTTSATTEQLVYTISNEIYTAAATDTKAFQMEPEELHKLLYGSGTVEPGSKATLPLAARVEAAKASELGNNLLINALQFRAGREGAPDKVYLPNTETVKETKEGLYAAWNEILASKEYNQLGKDLIKYAFYTSGFSKSVGDFSEHIPNEWLKSVDFHEDIKLKNAAYSDHYALEGVEDKIFKNLYKNNQLVPVVGTKSIKPMTWSEGKKIAVDIDHGFLLTQHDSNSYTVGDGPHGKIFKRFLKREVPIMDQYEKIVGKSYMLYRLQGYTKNNDAVYIRTNTLGMSGFGNNIKEYIGDGKTSIFPKNNVSLPEGLTNLVDVLEQRGSGGVHGDYVTSQEQNLEGEVNDRLTFCIMK